MKNIPLLLFAIVAIVQLYIPAQMILGREKVIREGQEFKFTVAPIDPSDPLRGKYIDLNFEATQFELNDTTRKWEIFEEVYVSLTENQKGFATISNITKEAPKGGTPYVKAKIQQKMPYDRPEKLVINYPFERFYMEESKAYDAELAYRESLTDPSSTAYAVVYVKDGDAVITEVMIDNVPFSGAFKREALMPFLKDIPNVATFFFKVS
jgi:uncharacterized membrane-anchored protein